MKTEDDPVALQPQILDSHTASDRHTSLPNRLPPFQTSDTTRLPTRFAPPPPKFPLPELGRLGPERAFDLEANRPVLQSWLPPLTHDFGSLPRFDYGSQRPNFSVSRPEYSVQLSTQGFQLPAPIPKLSIPDIEPPGFQPVQKVRALPSKIILIFSTYCTPVHYKSILWMIEFWISRLSG